MNRLTRITAILIQLQSKKVITAQEIANRFEVSLRTIYRDIKTLQDAGVPIGSENGVGYFIVDGYTLPPVSFTEEEANALIVAEKVVLNQGDTSLQQEFTSLLLKIKSILRSSQKEDLSLLDKRVSSSFLVNSVPSDSLTHIQKSITKNQVMEIRYRAIQTNNITQRKIEPLALYYTSKAWVVIAYCQLRKGLREFRLDRILQYKNLLEKPQFTDDFNLQDYHSQIS